MRTRTEFALVFLNADALVIDRITYMTRGASNDGFKAARIDGTPSTPHATAALVLVRETYTRDGVVRETVAQRGNERALTIYEGENE